MRRLLLRVFVMSIVPKKVRCPYCRSERLRAEPVSKSGFCWHHCIACGERFSARVSEPPRRPMKAGLRPPAARRKQS
jgi:transposase-like protein